MLLWEVFWYGDRSECEEEKWSEGGIKSFKKGLDYVLADPKGKNLRVKARRMKLIRDDEVKWKKAATGRLLGGKEVNVPRFDVGSRDGKKERLSLSSGTALPLAAVGVVLAWPTFIHA